MVPAPAFTTAQRLVAIFLYCAALKFIPSHYGYFLLKNVLFDVTQFFH